MDANKARSLAALAAALAVFGLINAAAVAGGAWFGPGARHEAAKFPKKPRKYATQVPRGF